MREWRLIGHLVGLRYRLIWAEVRWRPWRAGVLVVSYLAGGAIAVILSLAGIAAAGILQQTGAEEQFVRWILVALLLNGLALTVVLGVGPRMALSDRILRQYPVSARGRLIARHAAGCLDPLWLLLLAAAIGLAIGFAAGNTGVSILGPPAAVLYIAFSYLASVLTSHFIDRILVKRFGSLILSGFVFISFISVPFILTFLAEGSHAIGMTGEILRYLPPGLAAALVVAPATAMAWIDFASLAAWCGLVACAIASLERKSNAAPHHCGGDVTWHSPYDCTGRLFGETPSPLIARALRYQLRCNRIRLNLAMAVPMVVFLPALMGRREGAKSVFVLQLALFFLAQPMATSSTLLNQFGLDASGVRRFLLLPVPFDRALRASSAALLMLGGGVIIPALILWSIVSFPFSALLFLLLLCTALAGAFLFSAIGLWTSILFPRAMRFDTIMSNAMSLGGTIVMTAAIALAFGAAFVFKDWTSLEELANYWWLSTVGLVVGAGAYAVSLRFTTKLLESQRDRLLDALKESDFLA